MRHRAPILAYLFLASIKCGASEAIEGLWSWHQPWTSAPPEIVEDSGPSWYASGLLLNLCEDGRLRMATGVLYRGTGPAVLGPSDGFTLYEGMWALEGEIITATYHLVYSELSFIGIEEAMRAKVVERLRLETGELQFSFHRAGEESVRALRLKAAATDALTIEDRYVECNAKT